MNYYNFLNRTMVACFCMLIISSSAFSYDENKFLIDRDDSLHFDAAENFDTLQIDSFNGDITLLKGNNSNTIHGEAKSWAYGKSLNQAEKRLSQINWKFSTSGKTLKLQLMGSDGGSNIKQLSVPANWNLQIESNNGKIYIQEGFGNISTESSNGEINIEGGKQVVADTSNGRINYKGSAKDFKLQSNNGKIEVLLNGNWKGNGKADSSNGSISIGCSGIIDAQLTSSTSNGQTLIYGPKLSQQSTGTLTLDASNGNIIIAHPLNGRMF